MKRQTTHRINYGTIGNYGLSQNEALGSTILASDNWNEHGNTGFFRYTGTTNRTLASYNSGWTNAQCIANGITESLVIFTDACDHPGQAFARCGGEQFVIEIRRRDITTCNPKVFGNGAITGARDLPGILTHEFGHTTGVGHHSDVAVMDGVNMATAMDRQLYETDYKCSVDVSGGYRNIGEYKRFQNADGTFGSATLVGTGRTKAHAGFSDDVQSDLYLARFLPEGLGSPERTHTSSCASAE